MTIVGTRRMIVYDDLQPSEKIRVYDVRVERPPHYDTFAEFHYSYHYGDSYIPYIVQEEPLKAQCAHFIDCIQNGTMPLTSGHKGAELVKILEASSVSLAQNGAPVEFSSHSDFGALARDRRTPTLVQTAGARRKSGAKAGASRK
jgi:predicted dehydrogenase